MVFSSVAALLGLSRASTYAAANAFAEALVLARLSHFTHSHALSLVWGNVAEVGMAAEAIVRARNSPLAQLFQALSPTCFRTVLRLLILEGSYTGTLVVSMADWRSFERVLGITFCLLRSLPHASALAGGYVTNSV